MHSARVKICGVMRCEDAIVASVAGADAIGMIFHPPAKRNISIDQARKIVSIIGPFVTPVGVFVDAGTERIAEVADAIGLRLVQLHGHESPETVSEVGQLGLRVLKAVRVDMMLSEQLKLWREAMPDIGDCFAGLVLETGHTMGGGGVANDWDAIARHQAAGDFAGLPAIIAAGGLTPDTVAQVVRRLRPWAVDVSSGVEASLGIKSREKIEHFIAQAQQAQQ